MALVGRLPISCICINFIVDISYAQFLVTDRFELRRIYDEEQAYYGADYYQSDYFIVERQAHQQ